MQGSDVHKLMSISMEADEDKKEKWRKILQEEAEKLCRDPAKASLPPLCNINHKIPLIDKKKIYSTRSGKCAEASMEKEASRVC